MSFVPLNAFQRIMRLWDAVAPYNAVQAFRVLGDGDEQRVRDAWTQTLQELGVGLVKVRSESYLHTAPQHDDSRARPIASERGSSLDELIAREMNFRFDPHDACPFRATILPENGTHVVGVTYHHWVADSFSIRWLLREWFLRMWDPSKAGRQRAKIARDGQWKLFGPEVEGWTVDEALGSLLRYRTRFCRTRRTDRPMGDCLVATSVHHLPDGIIADLLAGARRHRVTVNDVLLSAIAESVDELGVHPASKGRDELALGTVVDLRAISGRTMPDTFGCFLGFTTTMLRPADLRDFPRMLRTVSLQNAFHKKSKAPQTSVLRMGIGLAEAKLVSPRRWAELYRDRMPIAAAISNINMTRNWAGEHHPHRITDYFRCAPTGPMIPLIFTTTTLGNKLNFLITRQKSMVDDARNARIAGRIIDRLTELARDPRAWENRSS